MSDTVVVSEMKLPLTPEEITVAWLNAALSFRHPGAIVTHSKIEDVILGTSTKIRVSLEYAKGHDCELPRTMIVKGGFEEHSPRMKDMYRNEIRAYRDVLPFIDLNAPACYYAGSDPNTHQSIVIMEDLRAKGVDFCHAQRPHTYEQVAARLSQMARYHAQTWDTPHLKPGGRWSYIQSVHEGFGTTYQAYYLEPERWNHYIHLPRGAAISTTLHDREWMRGALKKIGEMHHRYPHCWIDGDTHLGNLYIEADGTPGFFDMQMTRAPWFMDVTYHMICALDLANRPRWEQALLVHYLSQLQSQGIEAPGFEEAFECYRREIAWGLFIFIINEVKFQTEAINTAYAARFGAAAVQHGTVKLLA